MTFWSMTRRCVDVVLPTQFDGLFIAPATTDLSSTDVDLVEHENRVGLLARGVRDARDMSFDVILIDCPPSLSLLTVNALWRRMPRWCRFRRSSSHWRACPNCF
jgi:cellulose biosynthesis protein BcsQ